MELDRAKLKVIIDTAFEIAELAFKGKPLIALAVGFLHTFVDGSLDTLLDRLKAKGTS